VIHTPMLLIGFAGIGFASWRKLRDQPSLGGNVEKLKTSWQAFIIGR
jgi:hypothetical protein